MIHCQRDFTIMVNAVSAPTVDAYWTFQTIQQNLSFPGSFDILDLVNSVDLVFSGTWFAPPPLPVYNNATGIIGNGLACHEEGAGASFGVFGNAHLGIQTANGWSVFGWFKVLHWADDLPFNTGWSTAPNLTISNEIIISWDPLGNGGFGANGPANSVQFSTQDNNFNVFQPTNFVPTIGQWYFFHFFFDGTHVGYSINNGAPVLDLSGVAVFSPEASGDFSISQRWAKLDTATTSLIIDEVGLKLSRMLTPTEVTYLYNGGAGRTWPL